MTVPSPAAQVAQVARLQSEMPQLLLPPPGTPASRLVRPCTCTWPCAPSPVLPVEGGAAPSGGALTVWSPGPEPAGWPCSRPTP